MKQVGIIDYGVGNLRSVSNALQHVGAVPVISDNAERLMACDRIVFPGVGAFGYGIDALRNRKLDRVISEAAKQELPVLAICLGMQLLLERSSEFGVHSGLGIIPGAVSRFLQAPTDHRPLKLPNVGWLQILQTETADEAYSSLMTGVPKNSRFYFVHSYHAEADNPNAVARATYEGRKFAAIVASGSVVGTQFHPEKSGPAGLRMLRNFVAWEGKRG